MKEKIHPKYFKTKANCACGAAFDIGSTKENIRVEICSKCHPLFTGKQKILDTEGRIEKFKKRMAKAAPITEKKAASKKSKKSKTVRKVQKTKLKKKPKK